MEKEDCLIIKTDGGICSQIWFYMVGRYFTTKYNYKVKFDNEWFESNGKSLDGKHERNFDLLKAFPNIKYEIASKPQIFDYKQHYYFKANETLVSNLDFIVPPRYMDGYYKLEKEYVLECRDVFETDYNILDYNSEAVLEEIKKSISVGIHVRRGDLTVLDGMNNFKLCGLEYYIKAIDNIKSAGVGNLHFFFFSDEPSYVEKNILPYITESQNYSFNVIKVNGADKGYMDLFLLQACDYLICSNGSLGIYAGWMSEHEIKKIILPRCHAWADFWKSVLMEITEVELI